MADIIWTKQQAQRIMREHGLIDAGWTFAFDRAVRRAGACHFQRKQITLSWKITELNGEAEVLDTLLHEAAHALAGAAAGHGPEWRRIARRIGCTGQRTAEFEVPPAKWATMCAIHGRRGSSNRRRKLICRSCHQQGVRTPITYVPLDSLAATL